MRRWIWLMMMALVAGCSEGTKEEQAIFDGLDADIMIQPKSMIATESGQTAQILVNLKTKPYSDVELRVNSGDETEFPVTATYLFTPTTWATQIQLDFPCLDDYERDGNQTVTITLSTDSEDVYYALLEPKTLQFTCVDDGQVNTTQDPPQTDPPQTDPPQTDPPQPPQTDHTQTIRFMSANITSGNQQTYDDGKGIHIFKAFKPDIVVIQEFNYTSGATALTKEAFGDNFYHYKGTGRIPNGIISRWPILSHGTWDSNITSDREWEWAIIDIPGDRDLLAVSVHLHGKDHNKEFQPLLNQITAKQKEGNYYVILGGDFNTDKRDSAVSSLCSKNSILTCSSKSGMYPVDQNENGMTSGERDDYYDYVIFDKTLDTYEIPITIGSHTYSHGHVIDSRVYSDLGELGDIPPVQAGDSWLCETSPHCDGNRETRTNMQHMAVIRDVTYSY